MTKMKFLKAESSYHRSQSSESSAAFLLTPDIGAKRGKRNKNDVRFSENKP